MASPDVRLVTETALAESTSVLHPTKGIFNSAIDLNALVNASDVGYLTARADNLINGPEIGVNAVCTVSIERNSTNSIRQRVTCAYGEWWRVMRATPTDGFFPWVRNLTEDDTPIISTDPEAPLADGQSMYLISEKHVSTTFNVNPFTATGEDHFTYMFGAGEDRADVFGYYLRDDGSGRGQLRMMNSGMRRAGTWDRFNGTTNCTVRGRYHLTGNDAGSYGPGVIARANGTDANKNGVIAAVVTTSGVTELIVFQYQANVPTVIGRYATPFAVGDEVHIKLAVQDENVFARLWKATDPEPAVWQVEGTTTVTDPGSVGLYVYARLARINGLEIDAR